MPSTVFVAEWQRSAPRASAGSTPAQQLARSSSLRMIAASTSCDSAATGGGSSGDGKSQTSAPQVVLGLKQRTTVTAPASAPPPSW
jgi:hypothetical protein